MSVSAPELIVVCGTPLTLNLFANSGNSIASIISARMSGFARAKRCASVTAGGQYGQVGVTNTCRSTSLLIFSMKTIVSGLSPASRLLTRMMLWISEVNSCPDGMP